MVEKTIDLTGTSSIGIEDADDIIADIEQALVSP